MSITTINDKNRAGGGSQEPAPAHLIRVMIKRVPNRRWTILSLVGAILLQTVCANPTFSQFMISKSKEAVIRQTSQITCGPAAVATLLTFHLLKPATEEEITQLAGTYKLGTTTLADLREALKAKGVVAKGFKEATLEWLAYEVEVSGIPIVVHFRDRVSDLKEPLDHYVLFIGQVDDYVLVSDPAQGEVSMHISDFLRRWDNHVLAIISSHTSDRALIEKRKQSARVRLSTLKRANSIISLQRF
jgi:predicted double-glycine peptidase